QPALVADHPHRLHHRRRDPVHPARPAVRLLHAPAGADRREGARIRPGAGGGPSQEIRASAGAPQVDMVLPLLREVPALDGRRVTVMGLGLFGGGLGVTRFLVKAGAKVTITDSKSETDLRESIEQLRLLPVTFRLGGHDERDFRDADLVIVNPAVPETNPCLKLARALETEMNLFFKLCRAKTILGVTGSNGKTTTTTLMGEILQKHPRRSWVGGNIGISLLEKLPEIGPDDLVALELSSFQLENLGVLERSPHVGVVLNISPNHLDRHGTMENYTEAKRQMVRHQQPGDTKILNWDDPTVKGFASGSPAENYYFSL